MPTGYLQSGTPPQEVDADKEVIFTYDVTFEASVTEFLTYADVQAKILRKFSSKLSGAVAAFYINGSFYDKQQRQPNIDGLAEVAYICLQSFFEMNWLYKKNLEFTRGITCMSTNCVQD